MELLLAAKQRVADGVMSAARCREIEKAAGFNANADGLLADRQLATRVDVMPAITWDWVHNSFQDGTFTVEVRAIYQARIANQRVRERCGLQCEFGMALVRLRS